MNKKNLNINLKKNLGTNLKINLSNKLKNNLNKEKNSGLNLSINLKNKPIKQEKLALNLQKIIKNRMHCVFISPHLDDAALSCGGLISYLSGKTKVTVVNVFTEAGKKPYTSSSKVFLKRSGYENAQKLFSDRVNEDKKVFKKIKVKVINLNFIDASFRKTQKLPVIFQKLSKLIPELSHVYPTYRLHVSKGHVSDKDALMIAKITKYLLSMAKSNQTVIFYPSAIGDHVDHVIINKICSSLPANTVAWSDYPYNQRASVFNNLKDGFHYHSQKFDKHQETRLAMIKGYVSQIKGLFPDGKIKLVPEIYFFKKN